MSDGWETARRLDRPNVIEANDDGTMKCTGKLNYILFIALTSSQYLSSQ